MAVSFNELIQSDKPVLVDFSAEWCGPCKMLAPILKEVKNKVGDDAKIVKIDVDANPTISQQLQIRSVPTLIVFQNGEAKWRQSGVVSATQLEQTLRQYMVTTH
ncbi:MAG: thioredoxin [Saprospiraceae bacterium]|nr:thioredoxin [Saprospiraceae bacterium]